MTDLGKHLLLEVYDGTFEQLNDHEFMKNRFSEMDASHKAAHLPVKGTKVYDDKRKYFKEYPRKYRCT